ncbi:hypothetical protein EA658_13810 [Pseudoxanthomonas winnipegensis]|uniref:Uncharacterized protein n=1 Tax=Pseudoxanthomonas winnipegensis TaxID=2480810 RepID=A0ABY1WB38_9GAMM|nr:hypothetical protein [Pseudoxanthomonas winnipegensis]TAA18217.1 hypothetical protein EA658_13810 [Pseudoxanthomonas winnipegensis]
MNLLTDDPADIAERLAARIAHRGACHVYAKPSGQVATYLVNDARNAQRPWPWLVGVYRPPISAAELLQDLLARRAEIQP